MGEFHWHLATVVDVLLKHCGVSFQETPDPEDEEDEDDKVSLRRTG